MTRRMTGLFGFTLLVSAGCAGPQGSSRAMTTELPKFAPYIPWTMPMPDLSRIAFRVRCSVRIDSVPGGIALHFTADEEGANELWSEVERLTSLYRAGSEQELANNPRVVYRAGASTLIVDSERVASHGIRQILELRPTVWAERSDDGARLVFLARSAADTEQLRARVRWHAADLLPGVSDEGCPTMPGVDQEARLRPRHHADRKIVSD
jgi:hypothetical protein